MRRFGRAAWRRRTWLCALTLAASACTADGRTASRHAGADGRLVAAIATPLHPVQPGLHVLPGLSRARLYVPAKAAAGPAPLLILLHGAGGRGEGMIKLFRKEADRRGIILLAPESAGQTWDAVAEIGRGRPPAFGADVARIDTALGEALHLVSADPARFGIAGFSDGAGYALSLGVRNSARFSAIMAFSAGMIVPGETGPPTRVFLAHGEGDRVLPISVPRDTLAPLLKQAGFDVTFAVFAGGHELPTGILTQALDNWLGAGP